MSLGFPQAAGITGMLTAAGMTSDQVHAWFQEPRRDLNGMSPATLVAVRELVPGAGRLLLEAAQEEARRRRALEIEEREDREQAETDEREDRRDIERDERNHDREGERMGALRYAGLVFHALRTSGRNPVRAAARAGRVLYRELRCQAIGHEWSWTRAHEIGASRRVCKRCLRTAPSAATEQRDAR